MASQRVLVYIDTNIYLRFYDSKQSNFKKLLNALEEINQYIFITSQIINEIDRNKQLLFKRSIDGYITQCRLPSTELPGHISTSTDKEVNTWNATQKQIEKLLDRQVAELKKISGKILEELLNSQDDISKVLSKIAENLYENNDECIDRARLRKNLGNPPGKRNDPIGDELNWELLIEHLQTEAIEDLIIVTEDSDYAILTGGDVQLNSFLYKELNQIDKGLNIFCFQSLADGLKKFDELKKIKTLPNSKELEKIRIEEAESFNRSQLLLNSLQPSSNLLHRLISQQSAYSKNIYEFCPFCNGTTPQIPEIIDNWSMKYRCLKCGNFVSPEFSPA